MKIEFFDIPVDIDSLSSFIESSKKEMNQQTLDSPYYRKIRENLAEANKIHFEIEKK